MNAQEARRKAMSISNEKANNQYLKIKKAIEDAVDRGEFDVCYYEALLKTVETYLREEGYDVSSFEDPRDGITITISW